MDVTPVQAPDLADALAWLTQAAAYVRFEPPHLVRVTVIDPDDESKRISAWRVTSADVSEEAAFLGSVAEARDLVRTEQAAGRFQFLAAGDRGWQGSVFRG